MDDQRGSRPDDQNPDAEGVRLIGADEAAEAMERGDIAPRRTDDELRYGDRPPAPPAGPRPALRFPLDASADPTQIERPPVDPAPDPVTGPVSLPHWTEPPTGEVPAVLMNDDGPLIADDEEDLDAWSSFATSTPRWRDADDDWGDDGFVEQLAQESGEVRVGALGDADASPSHEEYFGFDDMEERVGERTGEQQVPVDPGPRFELPDDDWNAAGDEPEVVKVGWPEDEQWASEADPVDDVDDGYAESYDDGPYVPAGPDNGGRNMPVAIGVAAGLGAVAVVCLLLGSFVTSLLVTVILGLCAAEYFQVLRRVGWEAATLVGLVASVGMPLAVYWRGLGAVPLVAFLALAAILGWYLVGAGGSDPRVLEGSGATMLGIVWIGVLGSSASAMLRLDDGRALLVVAVLATVAYDVAGLFGGKTFGHRPLSAASPNKTIEGLVSGMAAALLTSIVLVGIIGVGPWSGFGPSLLIGLGAAFAAPLGDLCQSLLKRDLGVKDMGSVLPGHGGALDRFDAMLFVLPTVLWLAVAVGNLAGA